MDTFEKKGSQRPQASKPTLETCCTTVVRRAVSELLEDAGNCRQSTHQVWDLHPLSDSLFSEQQKLRAALDWAHSFLSSTSDFHHEICRADSLKMADTIHRDTEKTNKYNHSVNCTRSSDEVLERRGTMEKVCQLEPLHYKTSEQNNCLSRYKSHSQEAPHILFTSGRDDVSWPECRQTENFKSRELQLSTSKQTPSHVNCRTSGEHTSNHRHHTNISESRSNQTFTSDAATCLIKGATSCWCNASKEMLLTNNDSTDMIYERAQSKELSGNQKELKKEVEEMKVEEEKIEDGRMEEDDGKLHKESSSAFVVCTNEKVSYSEPEKIREQMVKTANPSFNHHLKIPSNLTIYEQYQLCVDQLHHLRLRESTEKERKTPEETAAPAEPPVLPTCISSNTNPDIKKGLNKVQSKRLSTAEMTAERASDTINEKQDRTTNARKATFTNHGDIKQCDNLTVNEAPAKLSLHQENYVTSTMHLDLNDNKDGFMKKTAKAITSTEKVISTHSRSTRATPEDVEESAALSAHPGMKGHQVDVKGQKKRTGGRSQSRLCEKSLRTNGGLLPWKQNRPQSAGANKYTKRVNTHTHTKRHTLEDRVTQTSPYRDKHSGIQPTKTHTRLHDDTRTTLASIADGDMSDPGCKYSSARVPVCDWLLMPDEVWLSILSLLPHSDLCTAVQVCSRLHTLATDYTLWKSLRIENTTVTEQWLLSVAKCRPRSLCLYSCSSRSVTSCGLEMFFTLCKNTLKEISVIGCTGPGLHGDQMLLLVGQLCDHVTSVDVSWSGATDTGVKALSDGCAGLRLKSIVLNGCHISDDPLKKLVMRHKERSGVANHGPPELQPFFLCRLEVFGCQFLTPTCLQTVYEMCPGLQHLNIGQVPKVNTLSLIVMTSHLKSLISLNLTGLKAVTDAALDALLQVCVELQSLTLSSCPGVTDLTLHNISKYTPCIRSLDVSGCKTITDLGVKSVALGCKRLQQLDLSSTGTGNTGVTLLANYCSRHLHTVKLSFCHISIENILKLCRHCKRLNVLHLYGCARLPAEKEIREVNPTVNVCPLP